MSVRHLDFTNENFTAQTAEGISVICFGDPRELTCKKQHKVIEKAAEELNGQLKI